MSKNTFSGSAFSTVAYERSGGTGVSVMTITGGMTLRDYFAAKAMQGFCIDHDPGSEATEAEIDNAARVSYQIADAMLRAREAQP